MIPPEHGAFLSKTLHVVSRVWYGLVVHGVMFAAFILAADVTKSWPPWTPNPTRRTETRPEKQELLAIWYDYK